MDKSFLDKLGTTADSFGVATGLAALLGVLVKIAKNKIVAERARDQIRASVFGVFQNDSNFIIHLLDEDPAIASELMSTKDRRENLIGLFRDAYTQAPGLSWTPHHEFLVNEFCDDVSQILLANNINAVQSSTDFLQSHSSSLHADTRAELSTLISSKAETLLEEVRKGNITVAELSALLQEREDVASQQGQGVKRVPTPNRYFTGREVILQTLAETLTGDINVVCGLGGVGKSQLAACYAERYEKNYGVVRRVRAENRTVMLADLGRLAVALKLAREGTEISYKIDQLQNHLANRSDWLLIFDNADEPDEIIKFISDLGTVTGKVIVTSRISDWGNFCEPLTLDVWNESEAVAFLERRLDSGKASNGDELVRLTERLGYLPLALEQAAAYINAVPIDALTYLRLLDETGSELRRDARHERHPADYPETVATTWRISINRVEEDCPGTLELLQTCSTFAPDDIPMSLLVWGTAMLPGNLPDLFSNELRRLNAFATLKRYSLVSYEDDLLSMHRLVQDVVRDSLADPVKWLKATVNLQLAGFPLDEGLPTTYRTSDLIAQHLIVSSRLLLNTGEEVMLATTAMHEAARALLVRGNSDNTEAPFENAENLLAEVLRIRKNAFGGRAAPVALTLCALADCKKRHFERRFNKQMPSFEEVEGNAVETIQAMVDNLDHGTASILEVIELYSDARAIDLEVYGRRSVVYALRTSRLASAYADYFRMPGGTEALTEALSLHDEALLLLEELVEEGVASPDDLFSHLHNYGRTLLQAGKPQQALDLLTRGLAVVKANYPNNSPHVAAFRRHMGYSLAASGRVLEAADCFIEARKISKQHKMVEQFRLYSFLAMHCYLLAGYSTLAQLYDLRFERSEAMIFLEDFVLFVNGPPPIFMTEMRDALKDIVEARQNEIS